MKVKKKNSPSLRAEPNMLAGRRSRRFDLQCGYMLYATIVSKSSEIQVDIYVSMRALIF